MIAALLALMAGVACGAIVAVSADGSPSALQQEGEQKLTAAAGEGNERSRFGSSVALSGDGDLALVGAPSENGGIGAAFTFTRSESGGWSQQGAPLTVPAAAAEGEGCSNEISGEETEEGEEAGEEGAEMHACYFGRSVALSEDGSTAVVGAPRENGNGGAVWIYTRSGSGWTQATQLDSPEPGLNRHFGVSVAVSADGDTIAVGAPLLRGRVWVFARSGSNWVPVGSALAGAGEEGEGFFGHSVALSADGETVAVGAPGDNGKRGGAWVFSRSGAGWAQQGSKITAAGEVSEGRFGSSVALSGDGHTALVGARGNEDGVGAAWIYSESGGGWAQGAMLTGGGEASEGFGYSVALSANGASALIGAYEGEGGKGDAWLYERSSGTWGSQAQLGAKLTQRGAARYGSSVALSAEGRWRLLGGPFSEKIGAVWVFGPRPSVTAVSPEGGPSDGGTEVEIRGENLTEAEVVSFGGVSTEEFKVTSAKSIIVTSPPGMGKVNITVKTPFGVSSLSDADVFTYKISTGRGGGGGGGGTGGGGGGGNGSEGSTGGAVTTTPAASGPSSETVVLGFGASHAPSCSASLLSRKISVQRNYRALFKLLGAGVGACSGKLRLQVRTKVSRRHYRTRTIGTASFSIAASKRVTIKIRLNGLGRALLASGHGHLKAGLVIVKSKPSPTRAHTASVRLTRR